MSQSITDAPRRGGDDRRLKVIVAALAVALVAAVTIAAASLSQRSSSTATKGGTTTTSKGSVGGVGPTTTQTLPPVNGLHPPASIRSDCTSDPHEVHDTAAALTAWLDDPRQVPDGTTVALDPKACYEIEGTVYIFNRHHLTIEGNGAHFVAKTDGSGVQPPPNSSGCPAMTAGAFRGTGWPYKRAGFVVTGGSTDIAMRRLYLDGVDKTGAYDIPKAEQAGILIGAADGVMVDHVDFAHVYGDSVEVLCGGKNATIQNSRFAHNGRECAAIYWGELVTFQHNVCINSGKGQIDVETLNDHVGRHIRIIGNDVTGGLGFFTNQGFNFPGKPDLVGDITVEGNVCHQIACSVLVGGGYGDPNQKRHGYTIVGNVGDPATSVKPSGQRGLISLTNVDGAVIARNFQRFRSDPSHVTQAVSLTNCTNIQALGNAFAGAASPVSSDFPTTTLAQPAPAGATSIQTAGPVASIEAYILEPGPNQETVTITFFAGNAGTEVRIGQSLKRAHPAGAALVPAPSTGVSHCGNVLAANVQPQLANGPAAATGPSADGTCSSQVPTVAPSDTASAIQHAGVS